MARTDLRLASLLLLALTLPAVSVQTEPSGPSAAVTSCRDLILNNRVTLIYADGRTAGELAPAHC